MRIEIIISLLYQHLKLILKVSNLNLLALDFAGFLFFKSSMRHDSATKLKALIFMTFLEM
jgi:hypothetical protein